MPDATPTSFRLLRPRCPKCGASAARLDFTFGNLWRIPVATVSALILYPLVGLRFKCGQCSCRFVASRQADAAGHAGEPPDAGGQRHRPGIKIVDDQPGSGREVQRGDRVRIRYDVRLNRGDSIVVDQLNEYIIGDRNTIAGFRYGLEGMREGGRRTFRASPHLCYGDQQVQGIPPNAVLVFEVKSLEIVANRSQLTGNTHDEQ